MTTAPICLKIQTLGAVAGEGHMVGSVRRAAGFPDLYSLSLSFDASGDANHRSSVRQPLRVRHTVYSCARGCAWNAKKKSVG